MDENCEQSRMFIEVETVRCPISGDCICQDGGELTYMPAGNTEENSIMLTGLIAGNRYCYRSRVVTSVATGWIYPPNGTLFTTTRDHRPLKIDSAAFISGETYECDGGLNAFGGSRKQTSAVFSVETGQWTLTEQCAGTTLFTQL